MKPEFIILPIHWWRAVVAVLGVMAALPGVLLLWGAAEWFGQAESVGPLTAVQATYAVSIRPATPPCLLGSSDPLDETHTARLIWWTVATGRAVDVSRVGRHGDSYGSLGDTVLFMDPCRSSDERLATVLHELGHAFEPLLLDLERQQLFADQVAIEVGALLGRQLADALPARPTASVVKQQFISAYRQQILEAAEILAKVATQGDGAPRPESVR